MEKTGRKIMKRISSCTSVVAFFFVFLLGTSPGVKADEADARKILKTMSDYMASQKSISFGFDAALEVVTVDEQKLSLASSGTVTLNRPDRIHVSRSGGFTLVQFL